MIEKFREELAAGNDVYAIYAKYKNLSIREEFEGGDIDIITRCQFVCDIAKHMITEKAMILNGYKKDDRSGMWEPNERA
mgnify:CR=1 FL=1